MRLQISEVSFAVLGWFLRHPLVLAWRKFCLEDSRDFAGQIALDGKHIGQIAIVFIGPDVPVVLRVDQLHTHTHPIPFLIHPHAPLQNGGRAQRFPDLADVMPVAAIPHDGRARNHFQIADLGEARQDIVLDAVGEIGVGFVVAVILKREHGDRLIEFSGRDMRENKKAGHHRDEHAEGNEQKNIPAPMAARARCAGVRFDPRGRLNSGGRDIENPRQK